MSVRPVDVLPVAAVLGWYARAARDLPWRRPGISPWAVLVSEVMLQQTPVARVLPAYLAWLDRWPTPGALAAEPAAEAIRQWDRLGYPRRALRLHAAATQIADRFGGVVPRTVPELLTLPGIGEYTARAVAVFAYRQRHGVVDTNVRRVLARAVGGRAAPGPASAVRDLAAIEAHLPEDAETAARFGVAVMEIGALVCSARAPRCEQCPLAPTCAWRRAGYPPATGPARTAPGYAGTDRQARGRLLAVLRTAAGRVGKDALDDAWPEPVQRERALASLVTDGLAHQPAPGCYALGGAVPTG